MKPDLISETKDNQRGALVCNTMVIFQVTCMQQLLLTSLGDWRINRQTMPLLYGEVWERCWGEVNLIWPQQDIFGLLSKSIQIHPRGTRILQQYVTMTTHSSIAHLWQYLAARSTTSRSQDHHYESSLTLLRLDGFFLLQSKTQLWKSNNQL